MTVVTVLDGLGKVVMVGRCGNTGYFLLADEKLHVIGRAIIFERMRIGGIGERQSKDREGRITVVTPA